MVHVGRLADGSRKVLSIAELTGLDDEMIALQELFVSEATGGTLPGRTRLTPTGIRPRIMDKIHHLGVAAPELSRLYPKNSAGTGVSGRRANAVQNQSPFRLAIAGGASKRPRARKYVPLCSPSFSDTNESEATPRGLTASPPPTGSRRPFHAGSGYLLRVLFSGRPPVPSLRAVSRRPLLPSPSRALSGLPRA